MREAVKRDRHVSEPLICLDQVTSEVSSSAEISESFQVPGLENFRSTALSCLNVQVSTWDHVTRPGRGSSSATGQGPQDRPQPLQITPLQACPSSFPECLPAGRWLSGGVISHPLRAGDSAKEERRGKSLSDWSRWSEPGARTSTSQTLLFSVHSGAAE